MIEGAEEGERRINLSPDFLFFFTEEGERKKALSLTSLFFAF